MHQKPYVYWKKSWNKYLFVSTGVKEIIKSVEFTITEWNNVYNLGFGDRMPDGKIDDTANSNNGDITRIFITVIDILQDFTSSYPSAKIYFCGCTMRRTALYNRIIRTYYQSFSECFIITGCTEPGRNATEIPFDPESNTFYYIFFVKRNN